eukprot:m.89581 g.89581  ORF g.89581 m.89581 type:complete len:234 (+) comp16445_c0_seq1:200-901(+)
MRVWCYTCESIRLITDGHPVVCPACHSSFVEEMQQAQRTPDPYQRGAADDHHNGMAVDDEEPEGDSDEENEGEETGISMETLEILARILQARAESESTGNSINALLQFWLHQRLQSLIHGHGDVSELLLILRVLSQNAEEEGVAPASSVALDALVPAELDDANAGEPCPVCQEPIAARQSVQRLGCSHFFHPDCIVPWLKIHATCPVCRYDINEHAGEAAGASAPANDVHAQS